MSQNFLIHLSDVFDITQGNSPMHHTGAALTFSSLSLLHEAAWRAEETTRHNQTNTHKKHQRCVQKRPSVGAFFMPAHKLEAAVRQCRRHLRAFTPALPWLLHPAFCSAAPAATRAVHGMHQLQAFAPWNGFLFPSPRPWPGLLTPSWEAAD